MTAPALDELRIDYMPLDYLAGIRVEDNPKEHDVPGIKLSIQRRAFNAPPTIDETSGRMVAGHGRIEALLQMRAESPGVAPRHIRVDPALGWMVPVVRGVSFADDDEFYEYLVSDNALTIARGWEEARIGPIIQRLHAAAVPLTSLGHAQSDISAILRSMRGDQGAPPDPPPADPGKWGAALGCSWEIRTERATHRLVCGDSRDLVVVRRLFGEARAEWMWTDPPYGIDYLDDGDDRHSLNRRKDGLIVQNDGAEGLVDLLRHAFASADAILTPGSPIYVASPPRENFLVFANAFVDAGWHWHETLIWVKDRFVFGRCDYHHRHEPVFYGWKTGAKHRWYGGRDKDTVVSIDRPFASKEHPTMKPVELIVAMLTNSAKVGAIGFEPFAGSGSTMVAADRLSCPCYAVEISPAYCSVVLGRMEAAGASITPDPAKSA